MPDAHWTGGDMMVGARLIGGWRPVVSPSEETVSWDVCPHCGSTSHQGLLGEAPVGAARQDKRGYYHVDGYQGSAKIQCLSCGLVLSGEYRSMHYNKRGPPEFHWEWHVDAMPQVEPPRSRVSLLADDDPHPQRS